MRNPLSAMLALALLASPAAAPAAELPALISRLTEHTARAKALSESGVTVVTRIEQLDGKGQIESRTEFVDRRFVRDGSDVRELRRFVRDGKDGTEEEKARRAAQKAKESGKKEGSMSLSYQLPFSEEGAGRHSFSLAGPDPENPKLTRVAFQPKGGPTPEALVGEAGVDPVEGTVRWIRFRPSKNPKHVTRMDVLVTYGLEAPGGPALSRIAVDAEGGILFIKKRYRSESTYSDYGGGSAR